MKIQTFIFNWRGQYAKTKEKISQLHQLGIEAIVINSDDAYKEYGWHNIGEESYFTDQFLKALELFDGDILFHIQGDASYDNWEQLIADAKNYYEKYEWGIYAPNIDYTWYDSSRTDLPALELEEENLKVVANTDCTCWFIHKDIIEEAKSRNINFGEYKMGWSFDIIYPSICFLKKRLVLRDYAHTIQHPKGTNYNTEQAESEMRDLFEKSPKDIQEAFLYIKTNREKLYNYFR